MKLELPNEARAAPSFGSQCKRLPEGSMLAEICTPAGHLCSVTAECHSHIADIKNQIETATGIPRWEQRLISGQDQLRDGDVLNSIGKGTLNLLLLRRDSEQVHWLKTFAEDSEKDLRFSSTWQQGHCSLQDAPEKIRSDREVVAAAVSSRGSNLKHASKELRGDKGLALLAIERCNCDVGCYEDVGCTDDGLFMHLSDELRADHEVVAAALQRDATSEGISLGFYRSMALRRASETLRNDKGFVLEAVRRFGIAIYDAPRHLGEDSDVILTALRHHPHMELGGCTCRANRPGIECPPQLRRQKEFVLKAAHLGQFNFVLSSSHYQWHDSANQNWANDQDFMQQLAPVLYALHLSRDRPIDIDMCYSCDGNLDDNYTCIRGEAGNGQYNTRQTIYEAVREMGTMLAILLRKWKVDERWIMLTRALLLHKKQEERKVDEERILQEYYCGQYWDDVYNRKQILEEARTRKWFRDSARQSRSRAKKQRSLNSQAVRQRGGRHKVPDIDFWDL